MTLTKLAKIKLILLFIFVFILVMSSNSMAFDLGAYSAILVEADTGQVLYEENADEELPPASITKIMTMLLTMEAVEDGEISLSDPVTISTRAADMGGSQIFLEAGSELTVEELMKAVTISSANDATYALSEYVGGTYSSFVEMMNERARELGMENTNFVNSTGLPAENHYTSARDITKMAREVIQYPEIQEWGQIWVDYLQLDDREAMLANLNRLVRDYPGMDGIKTGRTEAAGYCLAGSAEREDLRLISVIMNADSDEERQDLTRELLDYGFGNFVQEVLLEQDELVHNISFPGSNQGEVTARAASDLTAVRERGEDPEFAREVETIEEFEFPIAAGEKMGEMIIYQEDTEINRVDLLAEEEITRAGIISRFFRSISDMIGDLF